jgi:cell division transport system permease protein
MKRKLITLRRILIAGVKNFVRNSWLSIAAIAVMVVSIIIILSSIVMNVATQNTISELSKNIKIAVYFLPDTEEDQIFQLKKEFESDSRVAEVTYISSEKAQNDFIETNKADQQLLQGLALIGGNSLPASLEVSVSDLSLINSVADIARQDKYKDYIEDLNVGKQDVQRTINDAANAQRFITRASIIAASIFVGVSILIIFNTIRMAIFTRQEEIRTEKLLGATRSYIKGPFLVESAIYGIVSGVVGSAIVLATVRVITHNDFAYTRNYFSDPKIMAICIVGSVLFGMIVGYISSSLAISKYLRLKRW